MMHLSPLVTLLLLSTLPLTLAHPKASNTGSTIWDAAALPHCPSTHYPTFSQYKAAISQYCSKHFSPSKWLRDDEKVVLTYTLKDGRGYPIKWILSVTWDQLDFQPGGKLLVYQDDSLLLSWAATLLASPLQGLTAVLPEEPYPPLANTTFSLRSDTKPCPSSKHHYPTLSKWKQALNQYCDRHTPKGISSDEALTLTYTIPAWDKKPIKWIFRVSIDNYVHSVFSEDDPVRYEFTLSREYCKKGFMQFVEGGRGGDVGKVYCDREGEVLVLGGEYRDYVSGLTAGQAVWETRQMNGDLR
ncbi:hypothetical protein DDE82_000054 [Stemphylium lycopersici]|nr:hypothetical protein DDE82_000054 [Stemphylium lycopersici]